MRGHYRAVAAALLSALTAGAAHAQLAISANDAKVKLTTARSPIVKDPPPDTVTLIDLRTMPPKVIAEIEAPSSVVGPPTNVAISPQGGHRPRRERHADRSGRREQADPRRQADGHRPAAPEADAGQPTALGDRRGAQGRRRQRSPRSSPRCRPARAPPASRSTRPARWRWWPIAPRARFPYSRSRARRWSRPARSRIGKEKLGAEPRGVRPRRQERAGDPRRRSPHLHAHHRRQQGGGCPSARSPRASAPMASTSPPRARWPWSATSASASAMPIPSASSTSRPSRRA